MTRGIAFGLLFACPFWATVALVLAGPLAAGYTVIAFGVAELLLASVPRPPRYRVLSEEKVGTVTKKGLRLTLAEYRALQQWRRERKAA